MDLYEFAVRVKRTLLVKRRLRRTRANHGVRRLSENSADAAGANDDGIGWEGTHFHVAQVHGANTAANAVAIEHGGQMLSMRNDAVIVSAGGVLPSDFLRRVGISVETKYGTA